MKHLALDLSWNAFGRGFSGMKSRPNRLAVKWTLRLLASHQLALSRKRINCPEISDLQRPATDGGTSSGVVDTTMTVKSGRARRNSKNILRRVKIYACIPSPTLETSSLSMPTDVKKEVQTARHIDKFCGSGSVL